jgi:hypothetical protein
MHYAHTHVYSYVYIHFFHIPITHTNTHTQEQQAEGLGGEQPQERGQGIVGGEEGAMGKEGTWGKGCRERETAAAAAAAGAGAGAAREELEGKGVKVEGGAEGGAGEGGGQGDKDQVWMGGAHRPPSECSTGEGVAGQVLCYMIRAGQNHGYTVYIRYFWQENHQIYGQIRCICTVLADLKCEFVNSRTRIGLRGHTGHSLPECSTGEGWLGGTHRPLPECSTGEGWLKECSTNEFVSFLGRV